MGRSASARARRRDMRLTIVGSGDAFGSGGRFNTCFHVATRDRAVLIDCGASTMVALRAHAIEPNSIDAIILTHLHGDHFGGIPFLLLDAQYMSHREGPLTIAGPPGTRERIAAMLEAAFPSSPKTKWRFPWSVTEIAAGDPVDILGLTVTSAEVIHYSGAPSTALRLTDGQTTLAYSGDTERVHSNNRVPLSSAGSRPLLRRLLRGFLVLAAFFFVFVEPAAAQQAIAMVIGNGACPRGPQQTSLADGGLVAEALTSIGFE